MGPWTNSSALSRGDWTASFTGRYAQFLGIGEAICQRSFTCSNNQSFAPTVTAVRQSEVLQQACGLLDCRISVALPDGKSTLAVFGRNPTNEAFCIPVTPLDPLASIRGRPASRDCWAAVLAALQRGVTTDSGEWAT